MQAPVSHLNNAPEARTSISTILSRGIRIIFLIIISARLQTSSVPFSIRHSNKFALNVRARYLIEAKEHAALAGRVLPASAAQITKERTRDIWERPMAVWSNIRRENGMSSVMLSVALVLNVQSIAFACSLDERRQCQQTQRENNILCGFNELDRTTQACRESAVDTYRECRMECGDPTYKPSNPAYEPSYGGAGRGGQR